MNNILIKHPFLSQLYLSPINFKICKLLFICYLSINFVERILENCYLQLYIGKLRMTEKTFFTFNLLPAANNFRKLKVKLGAQFINIPSRRIIALLFLHS